MNESDGKIQVAKNFTKHSHVIYKGDSHVPRASTSNTVYLIRLFQKNQPGQPYVPGPTYFSIRTIYTKYVESIETNLKELRVKR